MSRRGHRAYLAQPGAHRKDGFPGAHGSGIARQAISTYIFDLFIGSYKIGM
jgi:hypothetical protein